MSRKLVRIADLFCGAGGTSSGAYMAADDLGVDVDLLAVNHWKVAIATHSANHTEAVHLCETLDGVNPRKVVPRGRLDLLVASPECTHHSNARGGRPMSDQSRASAWHVVRWAEALRINSILIENVREFEGWGPLGCNGKPLKSRKGETFRAFIQALQSLNYRVAYAVLNAADYGDPTTRERLFVMCKLGQRRRASFPLPTHSCDPASGLLPWRSARDHVIDWSDHGNSILNRPKTLSLKTIARIAHGFYKHGGLDLRPFLEGFIVKLYGTGRGASARRPLPTVTGQGGHLGVVVPFLLSQQSGGAPRSADQPAPTVAGAGAIAKSEGCLIEYYGNGASASTRKPLGAVTGKQHHGLAQAAFITEYHGGKDGDQRTRSTKKPLATQTCEPRFGLAQGQFIVPQHSSNKARSVDRPAPVVTTTSRGIGLVQGACLVAHFGERAGQEPRTHSVADPTPTVTSRGAGDLATILPVTHGGRSKRAHDPNNPLPVVTTARRGELAVAKPQILVHGSEPVSVGGQEIARAAIIQVELDGRPWNALQLIFDDGTEIVIDILFRMLRPRELARAQGFPDSYQFTGKTEDVVKQIGNAVPVNLARALCRSALS